MKKEYRTSQRELDRKREEREGQRHVTAFLDRQSDIILNGFIDWTTTQAGRANATAIIAAIINGEKLVAHMDRDALTHLGRGHGLLKHAANTFPFKLQIDEPIIRITSIMKMIANREAEREVALTPNASKVDRFERRCFSFNKKTYACLKRHADENGTSLSATIRNAIKSTKVTSRMNVIFTTLLNSMGQEMKAAIEAERQRKDGNPDISIVTLISQYNFLLKEIEASLK